MVSHSKADEASPCGRGARRHAGRYLAALFSILAIGAASCERKAAEKAGAKPQFAVIAIKPQTARREQTWDGVVQAVNEATMSAQTSGRVLELPFDVNDYVPAGSLIVRLTDVEQQAALKQAQASADETEAQYNRIAQLYEKKIVAKASLDQARTRRETAAAALRTAQQQLDYTVVKAPYSGYVTKRFVNVGEEIQPGQSLIAGISLTALRVAVQIPQSAAAAVRKFSAADVLLDTTGAARVAATKVTIFPYADPQTHSFSVRIELPEQDTGLYPGMTVKVSFEIGETERLLVPEKSLVARSEFSGVYVVQGTNVSLRQLRLGHRYGDQIEVLAGLDPGEQIAADPVAAALFLTLSHKGQAAS
jgi:RND family efflux transporter MFP subunit